MAKKINPAKPLIINLPELGKVPPQAIDMEEAVLGAVMLEKEAVITILDILKPEKYIGRSANLTKEFIESDIKPILKKNSNLIGIDVDLKV